MKSYPSLGVGPAAPSPLRPHPVSFSRARGALSLLLRALCLFLVFISPAVAADGDLDSSFIAGVGPLDGVQAIPELQGQVYYPAATGSPYNGRSLIFGQFYGMTVGGPYYQYNAIARLNAGGSLDTTFVNAQIFGEVRSVYIYPADDPNFANKILIGGDFFVSSGTYYSPRFARLNADGSLDTDFPQTFIGEGAVNSIAVQGSGDTAKILVGGWSMMPSELDFIGPFCHLVRLNYDGNLDSTYTPWSAPGGYISDIRVNDPLFPSDVLMFCSYPKNSDGSGGNYYMLRLDASLNLSSPLAFIGDETVDGPIFGMARQSDGNYVICGQFQKVYNSGSWVSRNRVARLGSDLRTLDTFFSVGVGPNDMVEQISPMSSTDDRMVLAGNFSTWNGAACGYLVRLNATGTLDPTFPSGGGGADDRIMRVNWFSDGSGGLIYGYFRSYNGQLRRGIAGLDADGNLNGTYASVTPFPGGPGMVASLATQSDGKIIIGGVNFNGVGGKYRGGFARLNPDGSLDTSFKAGVNGWVEGVALQADGKILVAGNFGQCQGYARHGLARLNPDGSLDTAFNLRLGAGDDSGSIVHQVVPLSNGQLMITGYLEGSVPAIRLNSDGTLDPSFDSSGFSIPGSEGLNGRRLAVAGNKYVVAGTYNGFSKGFLVRLTQNGAVDPGFGPSNTPPLHILTMDGNVEDLLVQPDGKIVVSGGFSHIFDDSGSPARRAIARFSANGLLDNTFTPSLAPPDGANTIVLAAMARQPNGKILIEQNFLNDDNFVSTQVARLNSNGSLDSSFTLGNPAGGGFWLSAGNSILRLPSGKALIGGNFSSYNGTPAWSLVRIFAGPGNFSPGALYLLLEN